MSLWNLARGQCVERMASTFSHDFRVMLAQIAEEVGERTPRGWEQNRILKICAGPFDDFKVFAAEQGPEPERYEREAIAFGVDNGFLDKRFLDEVTVDGKYWWQTKAPRAVDSLNKKGFERYVNKIAKAISSGEDIPPLIRVDGAPADGRHRTFAANKLKLLSAPIVEFTSKGSRT